MTDINVCKNEHDTDNWFIKCCGRKNCRDCIVTCYKCTGILCRMCEQSCANCHHQFCEICMAKCTGCGLRRCAPCGMYTCNDCNRPFCLECLGSLEKHSVL